MSVNPRELDQAFRSFLHANHLGVDAANPVAGVRTMLRFYAEERADGCDVANDRDMLLLQWGTYDWDSGEHFELDIVRQVILPNEDDDDAIWQLHLTYRYPASESLRALGSGNRWCSSTTDLGEFERFLDASAPWAQLHGRHDAQVHVDFECAG